MIFALRRNGRTLSPSNRYRGSRTAISPSFVCQRSFFTSAMHLRLLTNFLFRHFDLPLRPPLPRLPPQMPHLLDDRPSAVSALLRFPSEFSTADYRRESISKIRVLLEECQKLLVAEFRRRHLLSLYPKSRSWR